MRQDIDSLVVNSEDTLNALSGSHERPIARLYIWIELQMFGHFAPVLQRIRVAFVLVHRVAVVAATRGYDFRRAGGGR